MKTMTAVTTMTKGLLLAGVGAALLVAAAAAGGAQAGDGPRVEIWTDRGDGSVYRPGDCARVHVRPYEDCYVMIYEIDTDGYLRVLFPRDCYEDGYLEGGRTYLLGGGRRKLYVSGPTGVDYIHVLASYEPFRRVYWDGCDGYSDYALEVTWRGFHDYWGSALPPRVYGDPYVAMQTIDEFICLDALEAGLVWADFTYFYVGARVDYPRYLCYDCHGFTGRVRPYSDVCVGFSISFVDCEPGWRPCSWWWWSSPRRVYCGPRYVCHSAEHRCSKKCDTKCDTYPSEYKWKSRHESGNGPESPRVVERFRAEDPTRRAAAERPAARGGNAGNVIDAARFKSNESSDPARERSLYSAGEAKRRDVRGDDVKTDNIKSDNGERKREQIKTDEPRGERTKSKSGSSIARAAGALSSIAKSITRSSKSSTDNEPKGKTPQVRQQGDKGKSQVTRRKLSR